MNEMIKVEPGADTTELLQLTSEIVSSHVSNNPVAQSDLPSLIKSVFDTLQDLSVDEPEEPEEELKPAVPIKKSVTDDYIVCLEDGKKLKMLKAPSQVGLRYDAGGVSGALGSAGGLSNGRAELCAETSRTGEKDRSGPQSRRAQLRCPCK